jgi:hypothetical protein
MNIPYTYRIGWSKTGMNYYGVRYAKDCHPTDLFVSYFTSSKYVTHYIKQHGLPDIIEVRRIFDDRDTAIKWEHTVLRRMNVMTREDYLNKNDGKAILLGEEHHIETQKRMINLWNDDEWRIRQISLITEANNRPDVINSKAEKHKKNWLDLEFRETQIKLKNRPEVKRAQSKAKIGSKNPRYDAKIYRFEHTDGTIENCTRFELLTKYNLSFSGLSMVINGHKRSVKGWKLA